MSKRTLQLATSKYSRLYGCGPLDISSLGNRSLTLPTLLRKQDDGDCKPGRGRTYLSTLTTYRVTITVTNFALLVRVYGI